MFDNPNRIRQDLSLQDLAEVALETESRTNERFRLLQQEYNELRNQMLMFSDRIDALELQLTQLKQP